LQHPQEVTNAKNTLGLLALSLKNSQTLIGEDFSPKDLHEALYADHLQPILLYPATAEDKAMGLQSPAVLTHADMQRPETLRLVVIDGTWRKSRKMLYVNPELQSLPRLSLDATPVSIYTIRKAHQENQLSTLEASCYALQQLEAQHSNYTHLLAAFTDFVAQQAAFTPAAHLHSKSTRDPESL